MRDVQTRLAALGLYGGRIDGIFGPLTKDAILEGLAGLPTSNAMQVSPAGVGFLAGHEGFVPGPYLDSVNVWTVYIGHTSAAGAPFPDRMPRGMPADAEAALKEGIKVYARDLANYSAAVRRAIRVPVEQHEFDAAVSFHINTGAIGKAAWVKSLNAGNRRAAGQQIMNWRTPSSIIGRRKAEQRLFIEGHYGNKPMNVWPVDKRGRITWRAVAAIPAAAVAEMVQEAQT